jgi:hypothetical protein
MKPAAYYVNVGFARYVSEPPGSPWRRDDAPFSRITFIDFQWPNVEIPVIPAALTIDEMDRESLAIQGRRP